MDQQLRRKEFYLKEIVNLKHSNNEFQSNPQLKIFHQCISLSGHSTILDNSYSSRRWNRRSKWSPKSANADEGVSVNCLPCFCCPKRRFLFKTVFVDM